MRNM